MSTVIRNLLPKVKDNLILQHNEDDNFLTGRIAAAIAYAESKQRRASGFYLSAKNKMSPTTEQAVIMLASHFYESRDGSTGGFFADNTHAAAQVYKAADNLLLLDKEWEV